MGNIATSLPIPEEAPRAGRTARRVAVRLVMSGTTEEFVTAPAAARLGDAVDLQITTAGGCTLHPDTTVVTVIGLRATIVPYQRVSVLPPNVDCPLILPLELRRVRLTFATRGSATVRIVHRTPDGGAVQTLELPIDIR